MINEVMNLYKLLIADDEYEIRHGLSNYFPWHTLGFEIEETVENGQQAIDYISSNHVDILLCDIMMPECTGIQVAEHLYHSHSKVEMIFLSAYRDFEYAHKALQFGVRDYILKPTKYQEIYDIFYKMKATLDDEKKGETTNRIAAVEENLKNKIKNTDPIIQKVVQYIEENFKEANLETVSKITYMSPTYISKYFKKVTNMNFSDYLQQVRMEQAAEMIRNQYKVYEICEAVGYTNSQNFTRSFKKHFGKTPNEYKKELTCEDRY